MSDIALPLTVLETYLYNDVPVLYSAHSADGQLVLMMAVDEIDGDEIELGALVTQDQIAALEAGDIDLRSAFDGTMPGPVWRVCYGPSGVSVAQEEEQPPEEWLPESGVLLL